MPQSSQIPPTGLRARVPEKNSQLVALGKQADALMAKCRSRGRVSLADLEQLKNAVHEAVELGHKARFLWLSADERADNLGRQLFDSRAEVAAMREELPAEIERKVRLQVAEDFKAFGRQQDTLSWGEAHGIAVEGLCACRGGSSPCGETGGAR